MTPVRFALLACVLVASSGCVVGPSEDRPVDDGFEVISDPNDYSYLGQTDDRRAHVHDYWNGETRRVIVDAPFAWSGGRYVGGVTTAGDNRPVFVPDGQTVIPGTAFVNMTATWTNRRSFTVNLEITAVAANGSRHVFAAPSGTVVSLPSLEPMNDLPHAKASRWRFEFRAYHDSQAWDASIEGKLHVEIARQSGPLPLAPAHVDPWGENRTLPLFDAKGRLYDIAGLGGVTQTNGKPTNNIITSVVPPETTQVVVRFDYNSTSPPALHYDPLLDYRGADKVRGWERTQMAPTSSAVRNRDGFYEWTLPAEARMWDSPYANTTAWSIFVWWPGDGPAGGSSTVGPVFMDGDYRLHVRAER